MRIVVQHASGLRQIIGHTDRLNGASPPVSFQSSGHAYGLVQARRGYFLYREIEAPEYSFNERQR